MKKMMRSTFGRLFNKNWVLAAILICGTTTFTACTNEDNPATPDLNVAEKILGKWMFAERNGEPTPTNKKRVYNFVSPTKAYISASDGMGPVASLNWLDKTEAEVTFFGNKVTLTVQNDEHTTMVDEYTVTAINDFEIIANLKVTSKVDGNVVFSNDGTMRFEKVTADYKADIVGTWECTGLTGGETYNDGNDRLEFLADGTYRYYRMDDNNDWQTVTTREFQDYFVDGTLLATRWKNQGEDELREWWEIESLSGDQMVWTALRQNADGSTFQQKMTWKKIDLNVAEKIIGKWIVTEIKGQPELTNEKKVYTFVSTTKGFISASLNYHGGQWNHLTEADVTISDNKVTLAFKPDEQSTLVDEFNVTSINEKELSVNYKVTITENGKELMPREGTMRFTKVADYSTAILGTWEGRCTSEGSVFDDGQEHRWQYNADGTYVYYVKDGNNWVPYATNTLNEYFVDGNLLCTRWIDQGQENREWWEINIDGDKMNWTALRQNPDGTTFTATFEMTKVE